MTQRPADSLTIRPACRKDASAAAAVLRSSIIELCAADHAHDADLLEKWIGNKTPEGFLRMLDEPGNHVLVAERACLVAGVCMLHESGEIGLNYVAPSSRFLGVSRAMLTALESIARQIGVRELSLCSSRTAQRFYLANGFTEQGAAVDWRGFTVQPMCKSLSLEGTGHVR